MTNGTPKTLKEAIENGFEGSDHGHAAAHYGDRLEKHVQDFIAQRFQPLLLELDDYGRYSGRRVTEMVSDLYFQITGKRIL